MTYRNRRLARAERLRDWAAKRQIKSAAAFKAADQIARNIPMGQPILVGHHSERRHRRDIARIDNGMRAGVENERMAHSMLSRADGIEMQAERAIYSDDPDAPERLAERIAELEAERTHIKTVNAFIRKHGWEAAHADGSPLTAEDRTELLTLHRITPYHNVDKRGYPAYKLQNLGGTITRQKQRLAHLGGTTPTERPTVPEGTTATARARLTVIATMTTPSRPGKKPRPVWNVTGGIAFWRPLLTRLGGSFYHGVFSFWEDPTEALEQALLAEEREEALKNRDEESVADRGAAQS